MDNAAPPDNTAPTVSSYTKPKWTVFACLRIAFFTLFATLFFMNLSIMLALATPLALVPSAFRVVSRFGIRAVASWVVMLAWILCGKQTIVLSGDWKKLPELKRILLFGNHQTFLDWFYLGILGWYTNNTSGIKFIILDIFRHVPFFGWTGYLCDLIFVVQKWDVDEPRISKVLTPLPTRPKDPLWLIIFPEGGFPNEFNFNVAKKYIQKVSESNAAEDGDAYVPPLPVHLVLPKSKGLRTCIQKLNPPPKDPLPEQKKTAKPSPVDTFVDFTIGFIPTYTYQEDGISPNEALAPLHVFGMGGKSAVLNKVCIDIRVLPTQTSSALASLNDNEFDYWLKKLWEGKDAMLGHFKSSGTFAGYSCEHYGTEGLVLEEGVEGGGFAVIKEDMVEFKVIPHGTDVLNVFVGTFSMWIVASIAVGLYLLLKPY
ncbi:hypothetical protein BJ741DRAFT_667201 [Chytriomyces cf. hyalinus JEL632]|nr:hypothetical protein BJ741DRAFT_667201 [Chytriomyces cf. hyalinus JEL632]